MSHTRIRKALPHCPVERKRLVTQLNDELKTSFTCDHIEAVCRLSDLKLKENKLKHYKPQLETIDEQPKHLNKP